MQDCPKVIDFSSWQGRVDYEKVKAEGVKAVYVRWGHGHVYSDAAYAYNYINAETAGLDFGAYQVLDFRRDPIWQADMYLAGLFDSALRPCLDAERYQLASTVVNASHALRWLEHVEAHLGVKPLIYTRKYWWQSYMGSFAGWSSEYPLWVANYTSRSKPLMPKQWQEYALWQYSKKGTIAGINGAVDFNRLGVDKRTIFRP